ncbi:hypothetical protein L6252_02240 [Candidatus Parcubacteria bacterium]|nr:hypothetical protein [Candidatus Parcubacteria bacterium]
MADKVVLVSMLIFVVIVLVMIAPLLSVVLICSKLPCGIGAFNGGHFALVAIFSGIFAWRLPKRIWTWFFKPAPKNEIPKERTKKVVEQDRQLIENYKSQPKIAAVK